jgi:hypothetical protein
MKFGELRMDPDCVNMGDNYGGPVGLCKHELNKVSSRTQFIKM